MRISILRATTDCFLSMPMNAFLSDVLNLFDQTLFASFSIEFSVFSLLQVKISAFIWPLSLSRKRKEGGERRCRGVERTSVLFIECERVEARLGGKQLSLISAKCLQVYERRVAVCVCEKKGAFYVGLESEVRLRTYGTTCNSGTDSIIVAVCSPSTRPYLPEVNFLYLEKTLAPSSSLSSSSPLVARLSYW